MDFFSVLSVVALLLPTVAVVCLILGLIEWSYDPRLHRIKKRWWATDAMVKGLLAVFVAVVTFLLMFSAADTFRTEGITDPNDGLPGEIVLFPYFALVAGYVWVCLKIHGAASAFAKARASKARARAKKKQEQTTTRLFDYKVGDQPPTEKDELNVPDWVKRM